MVTNSSNGLGALVSNAVSLILWLFLETISLQRNIAKRSDQLLFKAGKHLRKLWTLENNSSDIKMTLLYFFMCPHVSNCVPVGDFVRKNTRHS